MPLITPSKEPFWKTLLEIIALFVGLPCAAWFYLEHRAVIEPVLITIAGLAILLAILFNIVMLVLFIYAWLDR